MADPVVHCPIRSPYDIEPCDPDEIRPLLRHLEADAPALEPVAFPRGTVLPDGRLDLCKQSLGPTGCRMVTDSLVENTRIRSLLLGTDGIGDEGAEDVADLIRRNSHLETIYLGCNRISAAGVTHLCAALAENATVTGLWLKRNPIGPKGAAAVAKLLRRNRTLRVLDLVNTGIEAEGLAQVLEVLIHHNRTVERLYLGANDIGGDASVELLARLLRTNPSLRALLLSVNPIGDNRVRLLTSALLENQCLEKLGLASCGILAEGAQCLFADLQDHPSLRDLDLGYSPSTRVLGASANHLGDFGARAAARYLRSDPPLERLSLRLTGVGAPGRESLTVALAENTHLIELDLDGRMVPEIQSALRRNREARGDRQACPPEVAMIRSVYRNLRPAGTTGH